MKEFTNKYFSTDNRHFISYGEEKPNPERMKAIKFNNMFVFTIFSKMHKLDGKFSEDALMNKYMPTILSGNLARTDKTTGFNSKDLGEKIKFLVKESIKNPEKLEKFKNSFFSQSVLKIFYDGCTGGWNNEQEMWISYKNKDLDPFVKDMDPLNAAMKYYLNDPTVPVGLDMTTLIDGLIKKDANGNYSIISDFNDIEKKEEMIEAIKSYVELIKSTKKFKDNFHNPYIIETELENE